MAGRQFVGSNRPYRAAAGDRWQNDYFTSAPQLYVCTKGGPNAGWVPFSPVQESDIANAGSLYFVFTGNTLANSSLGTLAASLVRISAAGGISAGFSQIASNVSWLALSAAAAGISVSDAATSVALSQLAFTNSNNMTFTLSTTTGGSATVIGSFSQSNQSAIRAFGASNTGNTAGNTGVSTGIDWVIAGTNNVTVSESTTVGGPNTLWLSAPAAAAGTQSMFIYPDEIANSLSFQVSGSTSHVQPFDLPFNLSISYIRIPLTLSIPGSQAATATVANATRGFTVSSTINVVIYTANTGASSLSLASYASSSATWVQQATLQAGNTGSRWSSGHTISYPFAGGYSNTTLSGPATSASHTMNTTQLSNFTGLRHLAIPFATSLSEGHYWLMYGSSTSLSSSANANMTTMRILASNFVISQVNQMFDLLGVATNTTIHFRDGLGSFTTNAIATTASIALGDISRSSSNPIMPFQMIRQA